MTITIAGRQDEAGIKVVHADPETGDLYFIVYGYMHSGNYEGREGVMVYISAMKMFFWKILFLFLLIKVLSRCGQAWRNWLI